jgi:hypothetical protein
MNYSSDGDSKFSDQKLENWVMAKVEDWRNHQRTNYTDTWDEYNRIWRGIWSAEDRTRESERSRIISPASQQAVESSVSEIEEATFGRGRWFDLRDDRNDKDAKDIVYLREQLSEDFQYTKTRKAVAEILINAAVYGTGMGEIVVESVKEMKPATQPIMDGALQAVGVEVIDRTVVKLRPVLPQNFLIDPVASSVDEALGVAIDEFVSRHQVEIAIKDGIYRDEDIDCAASEDELEIDKEINPYNSDKVRLTKYYGLVPKHLFERAVKDPEAEFENLEVEEGESGYKAYQKKRKKAQDAFTALEETQEITEGEYVEAIVVIANGGTLMKVEENPFMMQDRPIVAFPWDVVPGRFWGRGVIEKGYNSQKALDAELRARVDALALTVHPMMAIDATRMPRGSKMDIRPGKTILTNGNPSEVLMPFKFGALDQVSFAQAGELQKMVQMATGAVDAAGIPGSINGEAAAGAVSMSLGAIIKRHKRTLINFQESFLIPLVEKTAWRYMQFDPEHYPVKDYKFVASSSLGVIAREYEVTQLVQLLQTVGQDSPLYPMLVSAVIDNMGLANREEMLEQIKMASQPSPEQQQASQMQQMAQMQQIQLQLQLLDAQVKETAAKTQQILVETQLEPQVVQAKLAAALSNNLKEGTADDIEFQRRAKTAELLLKEQDIQSNERIAMAQMQNKKETSKKVDSALGG